MREKWEGNPPTPPEGQEDKPPPSPPPPMWQQGEVGKARQQGEGKGRQGKNESKMIIIIAVPRVGEIKKLTISKIWQTSLHQVLE